MAQRAYGRGPAWSNSLFEDNAEFGFGMRLAVDKFTEAARELLTELTKCSCTSCTPTIPLMKEILASQQNGQGEIEQQRERVAKLKEALKECSEKAPVQLLPLADYLVKKSVWRIGGDGWAYDIGYGGLDHVIASGKNVNILCWIRRFIPTPAVRLQNRRRSAPWRSLPQGQCDDEEGVSMDRQQVRVLSEAGGADLREVNLKPYHPLPPPKTEGVLIDN